VTIQSDATNLGNLTPDGVGGITGQDVSDAYESLASRGISSDLTRQVTTIPVTTSSPFSMWRTSRKQLSALGKIRTTRVRRSSP
jgi:hypothetical protein